MSESARIGKLLERQRLLQCAAAIQSARGGCCGITETFGPPAVPESYVAVLKTDVLTWGKQDGPFPNASVFRGTKPSAESARIKARVDAYKPEAFGGSCGYYSLGVRFIAPGCPPTPTEILNASLPKPSTRNLDCAVTRFEGSVTPCSE